MIRRFLTGCAFCTLLCLIARDANAQSTVSVSGDFHTATGANVAGLAGSNFLRVRLRNFAGNIPRTSGGVIAQFDSDIVPNASGVIAGSVYGNDDISPDGTFYSFDFYVGGRLRVTQNFAICRAVAENGCSGFSASFNFNTAAPISTIPIVAPGDGDVTYLRLDGGNSASGQIPLNAGFRAVEQAAPSGASGSSVIWSDSTAHRLKVNDNNGGATTLAKFTDTLSVFANTTSAELAGVLSDETGSGGGFVRATSPTLTTPVIASIVNSGTLTLPTSTDTLMGKATSDTVSNKTLTGATSGNSVTLLNSQDNSGAITGDGTDKTIFTYTLPANVMQAGKGIRITCYSVHTGTQNTTYKVNFGGTVLAMPAITPVSTAVTKIQWEVFNKSGVTNAQIVTFSLLGHNIAPLVINSTAYAIDTTSTATVAVTFSVAAADTETPIKYSVELIQ